MQGRSKGSGRGCPCFQTNIQYFQNFLGSKSPDSPRRLVLSALGCTPPTQFSKACFGPVMPWPCALNPTDLIMVSATILTGRQWLKIWTRVCMEIQCQISYELKTLMLWERNWMPKFEARSHIRKHLVTIWILPFISLLSVYWFLLRWWK